jgi:hypothetical protein
VLLDDRGDTLCIPIGYNSNVENFVSFLEKGLKEFDKRQGAKKKE